MLISAESILSARSPRRALVMTFTATGSFVLRFTALYTCDRGGGGACRAVDRRHPPKERQRKRQEIEKKERRITSIRFVTAESSRAIHDTAMWHEAIRRLERVVFTFTRAFPCEMDRAAARREEYYKQIHTDSCSRRALRWVE